MLLHKHVCVTQVCTNIRKFAPFLCRRCMFRGRLSFHINLIFLCIYVPYVCQVFFFSTIHDTRYHTCQMQTYVCYTVNILSTVCSKSCTILSWAGCMCICIIDYIYAFLNIFLRSLNTAYYKTNFNFFFQQNTFLQFYYLLKNNFDYIILASLLIRLQIH